MMDSKREELVDSMARAMFNAVPPPNPSGPRNGYSTQLRILARAALDVFESQPAPAVSGLDLDALEAVARAATPGPWHQGAHYIGAGGEPHDPEVQVGQASVIPDAKHMAAFDPPTVLALIARLREAEAQLPTCDGGCNYNSGPEETCSAHGRPPAQIWEIAEARAAERDASLARVKEAEARLREAEAVIKHAAAVLENSRYVRRYRVASKILASYKTTNDENGEGR